MYLSKVIKVGLSLSLLALLMPVSLANAEVRGEAVIRDSAPGLSDELSISLTMPILGSGHSYEGWLVTDDGDDSLSVGQLLIHFLQLREDSCDVGGLSGHPSRALLAIDRVLLLRLL